MRVLLALILASFSCTGLAADDPRQAAARRLVDLLQIDSIYQDVSNACTDLADTASAARKSYDANPKAFGGLSPRSAYWPDVEALYRRYRAEACTGTTLQAAKEIYVQVFAQRLSLDELERAAADLATPEGQALQAASREASRRLSVLQVVQQERATAAATQRFRDKMRELAVRFEADPQ